MTDDQSISINSEEDADNLLESIEQPSPDLMSDTDIPKGDTQEQVPQQTSQEYAFSFNGKEIKAPIDKILKWASQGYDAPNRIGDLNKQVESWKQKEAQLKEWESRYGEVDNYVKQNPQWWNYIQSQYQKEQQTLNQNPLNQELSTLKTELEDLKSYKERLEQERLQSRIKEEDSAYMAQIEDIKKQYPKVDFVTPDNDGKSLEYKVLEYAQENSIKNFKTAFRDFYHDELVKIHADSAKEKIAQDKVSKSKLGILGISPTPTKRISDSVKGKSYADLEREALEELGLR